MRFGEWIGKGTSMGDQRKHHGSEIESWTSAWVPDEALDFIHWIIENKPVDFSTDEIPTLLEKPWKYLPEYHEYRNSLKGEDD